MNNPFISIVLPTRDRADFVPIVLTFLQKQSFTNFEVIISDNGVDEFCQENIKAFLKDSRFTYKRPSKPLNMTDHWNFAIEGARGEYISIFNEKFFLRKDALQVIYETYVKYQPDLISWNYEWLGEPKMLNGEITGDYHPTNAPVATAIFSPSESLSHYFNIKYPLSGNNVRDFLESRYGRIYGGCVSKTVIKAVFSKYKQVFHPLSPDYTSQFLFLNEAKSGVHIGQSLMLHVVFAAISNGMNTTSNFEKVKAFLKDSKLDFGSYKNDKPLPGFCIGSTYSIARDLYSLKKIVTKGPIKEQQLNIPVLCFYANKELAEMTGLEPGEREEQQAILDLTIVNFSQKQKSVFQKMPKLAQDKQQNKWPEYLYASNFKHLGVRKNHQVLLDLSAKELATKHWCEKVMPPQHKSIFSERVSLEQAVDYLYDYNQYSRQFLGIK
ncbi:glycosyl transferase, family 2 [Paraglaciecola sp. T6c]|uniref:glycosyltransferase family 2 protein n=1 Tax=Pseudoalteromonas atlantica (strain T6c / ATCC BAA-1087) TaxID=3042615 RepID=UPI00005C6C6F|nr:glycosyltransferase [Paraglaciecola sp. T6c]ABG41570.1 glycosyl transferase, family 2 [Paraglaciecola sp. T6c]